MPVLRLTPKSQADRSISTSSKPSGMRPCVEASRTRVVDRWVAPLDAFTAQIHGEDDVYLCFVNMLDLIGHAVYAEPLATSPR